LVPCRAHVAKRNSKITKNVIFLNCVLLHVPRNPPKKQKSSSLCSKTLFKKITFFEMFELRFATCALHGTKNLTWRRAVEPKTLHGTKNLT